MTERFRVVVAATPKSGGEWVAGLLSQITGSTLGHLQNLYTGLSADLPSNVVIATAGLPELEVMNLITQFELQIVTVTRHPFDILINLLLEANVDLYANTKWGNSFLRDEQRLVNVTPRHPMFLQYAQANQARNLIAISSAWKREKNTYCLSYENLAKNTAKALEPITNRFNSFIEISPSVILNNRKSKRLGQATSDPTNLSVELSGIWRRLIPASQAEQLGTFLSSELKVLGYACDPDTQLTAEEADNNWYLLMAREAIRPLAESMTNYQAQKKIIGESLSSVQQELLEHIIFLNENLNFSLTSIELLNTEAINHGKETLQLLSETKVQGLSWVRFLNAARRMLRLYS